MARNETDKELLRILSNNLKSYREELALTQEDVSAVTGIKRETIKSYEKEMAFPNYKNLRILADYYNVSIDWLLGVNGSVPSRDYTLAQIVRSTILNELSAKNVIRKNYDDSSSSPNPYKNYESLGKRKIKAIRSEILPLEKDAGVNFLLGSESSDQFLKELTTSLELLERFYNLPLDRFEFSEDDNKKISYRYKGSDAVPLKDKRSKNEVTWIDYASASQFHFDKAIRLLLTMYEAEIDIYEQVIKHNGYYVLHPDEAEHKRKRKRKKLEIEPEPDSNELIYDEKTDTHFPKKLYEKIYPEESSEQIENNN